MNKIAIVIFTIFFSFNCYALDWSFGLEGASVLGEPAMGVWVSGGPVLFGIKSNFAKDVDQDHQEEPSWDYGPGEYLEHKNHGEKGVSSYNLSFDLMYLIDKTSRLNIYLGGYVAEQKYCPVYWTGDVNFVYNCPKWDNKKESGLDFRLHYDVFKSEQWTIPLAISTNSGGDLGVGIGWKGKLW